MAVEKKTFEAFKLNRQLLNAIAEVPYDEPTPIQQKAIPTILNGHDVIGIAQTGTGKTAAFVLPILMKAKYAQGHDPRVLILAPTRELVLQIEENIKLFATYTDLRYTSLFGGIGPKSQIEALQGGLDIVISTPGRFLDLYSRGEITIKMLKTMVLDEADKMMDMGFMPQIRRILEVIPTKRQNLLFSATMSPRVEELSHEFLEFPEKIEISPQATPATLVEQRLYEVPNFRTKINLLYWLLTDSDDIKKLIVFTKTKNHADNVFKFLSRKIDAEIRVIHANKGQNTRINAIEAFKNDEINILVATDVAARGIDVSSVSHVINFDVPLIYEDYVHRIGRTGRARHTGVAMTFANEAEMLHIDKIEKIIRQPIPKFPMPAQVPVEETTKDERQQINREIDHFKRKADPNFQGAFHEKKKKARAHQSKRRKKRR
ncbi:DEAD/DEAH box helicase [Fulvivirgaceae bacterium BMA12]|uniref:DEAD/DEAH box helicase n=1 Tax=Agaribacillus aureus TaxID=3051825 RepID=A0ABT8LE77_9BACT|nr:DEAD/DEAH box helicase [Fulvivirgaceae bacterium BMA12]